jgi:hypothetical protein
VEFRAGAKARNELKEWALALAQDDEVERTQAKHRLRIEGRLHATGHEEGFGACAAGAVRQGKVEAQRHPGGGEADDGPWLLG